MIAPEPPPIPTFSVGATLRAGRDRMGKDLSQVAASLRIRQPFLAALEEGRFKDLPGGTYAIGFLRTYSEYLGLDGEEMVRRFRQEAADALNVHAELQFPSPVSEGRMPSGSVLLTGLAVAVVAYGVWWGVVYNRDSMSELIPAVPDRLVNMLKRPAEMGAAPAPAPAPTAADAPTQPPVTDAAPQTVQGQTDGAAPPPAAVEEIKPTTDMVPPSEDDGAHGVAVKPATTTPTVPAPGDAVAASGRVVIKALSDECWIQVRESDGQLVVSRLLHQGDVFQVPDRPGLTLTAGNAGALQVLVDGTVVPSLGAVKEVKRDIGLDQDKLLKKVKVESEPAKTEPAPAATEPAAVPTEPKKKDKKPKSDKPKSDKPPKTDTPPKSDKPPKTDKPTAEHKTDDAPQAPAAAPAPATN